MMVRSNILHLGEYIMAFLEVLMLIYFMMAKLQCWEARNTLWKEDEVPMEREQIVFVLMGHIAAGRDLKQFSIWVKYFVNLF